MFVDVDRSTAVPLVLSNDLEEGDRHQAPCVRDQWITRLVPVRVVLSAYDVKEVSLAERELLRVARRGFVIIQSFDHLDVPTDAH